MIVFWFAGSSYGKVNRQTLKGAGRTHLLSFSLLLRCSYLSGVFETLFLLAVLLELGGYLLDEESSQSGFKKVRGSDLTCSSTFCSLTI